MVSVESSRILIIDDEPANIVLLQRILTRAGCRSIESLTDSREGLQSLLDFRPDLVLLDLAMPCVDGYSLLKTFRSYVSNDLFLPIVVLTADISLKAKEWGIRGKMNAIPG